MTTERNQQIVEAALRERQARRALEQSEHRGIYRQARLDREALGAARHTLDQLLDQAEQAR